MKRKSSLEGQAYQLDKLIWDDYKVRINRQQPLHLLAALSLSSNAETELFISSLMAFMEEQLLKKDLPKPLNDLEDEQLRLQLRDFRGYINNKYYLHLASLYLKKHIVLYFLYEQNLLACHYNHRHSQLLALARIEGGFYLLRARDSQDKFPVQQLRSLMPNTYEQYKAKHKKSISDHSMLQAFKGQLGLNLRQSKEQLDWPNPQQKQTADGPAQSVLKMVEDQQEQQSIYPIEFFYLNRLEENKRYTGRLKFFDDSKNYGFIVKDDDNSDIFVHYDDFSKANITREFLRKQGQQLRLEFSCMKYFGKYRESQKAVEIEVVQEGCWQLMQMPVFYKIKSC